MDQTTPAVGALEEPVSWVDYHSHYTSRPDHHISGIVRVAPAFYSPQLDNRRDLLVYLPPSYHATTRRYPVIYMHDGQNLFDHATSFAGEWGVDETMEALAQEAGLEAVSVGVGGDYYFAVAQSLNTVLQAEGNHQVVELFVLVDIGPLPREDVEYFTAQAEDCLGEDIPDAHH